MRNHFSKLRKELKKNFPDADPQLIRDAYRVADAAHQGQMRQSGDPYIVHTLMVARILANIGLDPATCAAGLLHDVLEDTAVTYDELVAKFGKEIADMVEGVTKISSMSFSNESLTREEKQAQNIRKMLVATAKDVRVILIKLADRLHNMRTLKHLELDKQQRIARETMDIYAPLAHRMGISRWKWELEDHAFHFLYPNEYREVARQVAMKRSERERHLNEAIDFLQHRLEEAEVPAKVIGRPKHLYSIFQKMLRQGKDFHEVLDILGIRIITHTESGCYNALGVVHSLWTPVPNRLKDYIAMPKLNMYQAIHTTVMRENGLPMEVQIRSEDMDRTAREGIAAHWIYKEGSKSDQRLDNQLAWFRQIYEWLKDAHAPEELMESLRQDFKPDNLYAFTPKGEVVELPAGATPLDFAYAVHSDVGHHCIGTRVNGRIVPLRYHLQTGDMVEVLTSKGQTPHPDWVNIVVTGRARTRIRQKLRELGQLPPLEDPLVKPKETRHHKSPVAPPAHFIQPTVRDVDDATRLKLIRVEGTRGLQVRFAKCCDPMPGHAIIAYITKHAGITIHRADCKSFAKSRPDSDRIIGASWEGDKVFEQTMRVVIGPRPNVLADLTDVLRRMNVDIVRAEYRPGAEGKSYFDFTFETSDTNLFERIRRTISTVNGVTQAVRLGEPTELSAAADNDSHKSPTFAETGS